MQTAKHYNFPTKVFHNETTDPEGRHLGWVRGYLPGDTMVEVFSYGHWGPNADKDDPYFPELITAALSEAFEAFNILDDPYYADHPAHEEAVAYRRTAGRSLSVGDMVVLGERTYVVQRFGWAEVISGELVPVH